MEGIWLIGQQPWTASLHPGAWAFLLPEGPRPFVTQFPLLSKVGVDQPLLTSPFEKSRQMHILSKAYDFTGFVSLRFKTTPSIPLLVMNYSEDIRPSVYH